MRPPSMTVRKLVAAAVALMAIAAVGVACGGGTDGTSGPEGVARRAVQALIDGDDARFLELVRLDQREYATPDNLRGCDLGRAQVLVEEPFEGRHGQARVTIVLEEACGASVVQSQPFKACYMDLVDLSGEWYLEATSHCAIV